MSKRDMFSQETDVFTPADNMKTGKIARIDAKSSTPRLEARGQSKNLSNKVISIGRDKSNQLIIADPKVSRHHALVTFENDIAYIKDTDSINGTYVNKSKLLSGKKYKLKNGDKIKVGTTVINFLR